MNKYLAESGIASRRKCDELIAAGKVVVNGTVERRLGIKIDENADRVKIEGQTIKPVDQYQYFILNKPKGYVTTASDERERKTVVDLIPSQTRVFPVGRLDKDTTGLLLLTSDGELAYKLTHPKFNIDKVYELRLNKDLTSADKKKLESGIKLEEGVTSACTVDFPNVMKKRMIRMTIHQGWKRQIRRMLAALGYVVLDLNRVGLAFLTLGNLKLGQCRKLTHGEVERLKKM